MFCTKVIHPVYSRRRATSSLRAYAPLLLSRLDFKGCQFNARIIFCGFLTFITGRFFKAIFLPCPFFGRELHDFKFNTFRVGNSKLTCFTFPQGARLIPSERRRKILAQYRYIVFSPKFGNLRVWSQNLAYLNLKRR